MGSKGRESFKKATRVCRQEATAPMFRQDWEEDETLLAVGAWGLPGPGLGDFGGLCSLLEVVLRWGRLPEPHRPLLADRAGARLHSGEGICPARS